MKRLYLLLSLLVIVVVGCGTGEEGPAATGMPEATVAPEEPRTLRVMTYSSFDMSEGVIAAFEAEHDATVQFLDAGDTGQMLNQAILSRDNPQADVMYGLDNTFLSRALEADIFEPYPAQNLEHVPDEYVLDEEYRVVPIDYGDVCLNYDRDYFVEQDLPVPQALSELTDPRYKGLLVVENPASSSPGLAFLITTIGLFGEDGYLDYWRELRENDVLVVESWDVAYYEEFSGGAFSEGARPLVVSYATSPAAEVYFSEEALDVSPTGAVVAPNTCFRQVEFAGILKNAENRDLAEAFIEYVLSEPFQEAIPLHMWVYPANRNAQLPQVMVDFGQEAADPVSVPAEAIEENREAWTEAWIDVVLR